MGQWVCGNVVYGIMGRMGLVVGGGGSGVVGNLVTGVASNVEMVAGMVHMGIGVVGPGDWFVVGWGNGVTMCVGRDVLGF